MRYYKVYRKCCIVAKSVHELKWEEYDQAVWDKAWEQAFTTTECEDGTPESEWLNKVERNADEILDGLFRKAESEGLCVGDFYLYGVGDDVEPWDMERPN